MIHLYAGSRRFLRSLLTTGACVLLAVALSLVNTGGARAYFATQPNFNYADTWNNIHPFLMFDGLIPNPAQIAPNYDFVSSAKWYNINQYSSTNPGMFLTYYIPFHRDNGTFTDSQALLSLNQWKAIHPDWILYKCDRKTPAYEFGDPAIPFDFSNPSVINYQVQTYAVPASQSGYNGITADNVNMENLFGACGTYQNGKWVQRYNGTHDDPRWQTDVVNWVTQMQLALHNLPHPLALIPNLGFGHALTPTSASIQQIISHSDGILDEAGFTLYGTGYLTDQYWSQAIQLSNSVQSQGKPIYFVNNFSTLNQANMQWALASYLIAKGHYCEIYISQTQDYGKASWFNEYNAKIGAPTGSMFASQGVYWRNYSNGLSIVNPSSKSTYQVKLGSSYAYVDLYGHSVSSTVTLSPHSGLVLLTLPRPHLHILSI